MHAFPKNNIDCSILNLCLNFLIFVVVNLGKINLFKSTESERAFLGQKFPETFHWSQGAVNHKLYWYPMIFSYPETMKETDQ